MSAFTPRVCYGCGKPKGVFAFDGAYWHRACFAKRNPEHARPCGAQFYHEDGRGMPARFHVEGSKPNGLGEPQLITLRKIDHPAWVETVARRRASDEAGAYPEGLWASALRSLAEANAKEGAP